MDKASGQFSWNRFVARASTLTLILVDFFVLYCVYTYYAQEANSSHYQIMQAAMLVLLFVALPIVIGQWFILTRAPVECISISENRLHKAIAVCQLFILLSIMLLPMIL